MRRAEWQPTLFGAPNRAELAGLAPSWALRLVRIRVHRNHGFEPVSSAVAAYAAWNGLLFDFRVGAYDDSLSFDMREEADADVIWLDTRRIHGLGREETARWLAERLCSLRAQTTNAIVVLAWPLSAAEKAVLADTDLPGVHFADMASLAASLGSRWMDTRATSISGTRLGNQACLRVARELACRWLPAAVCPPRKVVAVDLDDTLYQGVLAEDGPAGVQLTAGHRTLQLRLRELRSAGILLALVSRNTRADVEDLFELRKDFPLALSDFSAVEASWDDKAIALRRIADQLRVGEESIIFVDDNPGELAGVGALLPVFTVHAAEDAEVTANALEHVAGLFRWRSSDEDFIREEDLRASKKRSAIQRRAASTEDYLRSLDVRLEFLVGRREYLPRMAELCAKTNQFNLSLRRLSEAAIERRLAERPENVVAMRLTDRLSDSGIVGLVVGSRLHETLLVEEVCVSCRALGRRLEDAMLTKALLVMSGDPPPKNVVFAPCSGPRNAPARQWLAAYVDDALGKEDGTVEIPFTVLSRKAISDAITVEVTA